MKIEKNAETACVINLKVVADAEEIKPIYGKVVNLFVKNGEIRGFRKGKAPVDMVKRQFADQIREEAEKTCLRELCPKAVKESELKPISDIGAKDVKFSPETGIEFTAVVEIDPEVKLPKYKGISIEHKPTTVADSEVDERVESYRKAFAKFEDAKEDETVGEGDFVCMDFKGTIDGGSIVDIAPEAKAIGEAEGFWTQLEQGRFIPEVLEALKGMKAGETKTGIQVTFAEPAPESLVGKVASYDVTVKSFRARRIPDDAAFLEAAKVESIDKLKADFRARMEEEAKKIAEDDARRQVIESMLKECDFELPPSRVENQARTNLQDLAERAMRAGMKSEDIEASREQILKDCFDAARRQVRLGYILDAIVQAEPVTASDEDIKNAIELSTRGMKDAPDSEAIFKSVKAAGEESDFLRRVKRDKALQMIVASVK